MIFYNFFLLGERIKFLFFCIDFGKKKIKLSFGSAIFTENKSFINIVVGKVTLKRNLVSSGIDYKLEFSKELGYDNMLVLLKKIIKFNNKLLVLVS